MSGWPRPVNRILLCSALHCFCYILLVCLLACLLCSLMFLITLTSCCIFQIAYPFPYISFSQEWQAGIPLTNSVSCTNLKAVKTWRGQCRNYLNPFLSILVCEEPWVTWISGELVRGPVPLPITSGPEQQCLLGHRKHSKLKLKIFFVSWFELKYVIF